MCEVILVLDHRFSVFMVLPVIKAEFGFPFFSLGVSQLIDWPEVFNINGAVECQCHKSAQVILMC